MTTNRAIARILASLLLLVAFVFAVSQVLGQVPQAAHYRHPGPVFLPDSSITPGAVATTDTAVVCHRTTKTVRHTTEATKAHVYAEYGIVRHRTGQFEIDHLIPLELGGADTIANLWPEPAAPKPGFHEKDQLENRLHRLACDGGIALDSAQRWIAHDWYSAFTAIIGAWQK